MRTEQVFEELGWTHTSATSFETDDGCMLSLVDSEVRFVEHCVRQSQRRKLLMSVPYTRHDMGASRSSLV